MNAGKTSGREQLRKLLFRNSTFQRYAIEQKLRTGGTQEKTAIGAHGNGGAKLVISDVQLFVGSDVLVTV